MSFLFKTLFFSILFSVVVWFGLPVLKDVQPSLYASIAAIFNLAPVSEETTARVLDTTSKVAQTVQKTHSSTVEKVEQGLRSVAPESFPNNPPEYTENPDGAMSTSMPPAESPRSMDSEYATPSQSQVVADGNSEGGNQQVELEVPEETPSALTALNRDPGYVWGIVVTNSYFYTADLKRTGIMVGGTVVAKKRSVLDNKTDLGMMAECCYLKEDRHWVYEPVWVCEADLVMFDGTYEKAPVKQRDILVQYCRLMGRYEEGKAQLMRELLKRNPHFAAYQQAAKTYRDFVRKAKAMTAEYKKSEGAQREKMGDELRRMKGQEVTLKKQYEEIKPKYEEWKEVNITSLEKTGRLPKTPELQKLEKQIEALRPAVQEIVPGL